MDMLIKQITIRAARSSPPEASDQEWMDQIEASLQQQPQQATLPSLTSQYFATRFPKSMLILQPQTAHPIYCLESGFPCTLRRRPKRRRSISLYGCYEREIAFYSHRDVHGGVVGLPDEEEQAF